MINWKENLAQQAEKLLEQSAKVDTNSFLDAIHNENLSQLSLFYQGTEKYRYHSYKRSVRKPVECKRFGSSTLYRYTRTLNLSHKPVFVVPSLVNKSHILDLMNDFSFMRFLAKNKLTPYMLDWGDVGEEEKQYGFDDYYKNRLIPALDYIVKEHNGVPVNTIGYCMGGTMAIALACIKPEQVASLTLVAAPWDFHADNKTNAVLAGEAFTALAPAIKFFGCIPPDALQFFFTAVDPLFALKKYMNFAKMDYESSEAKLFVAVEDWLNDGVPLVEKVARTAFIDWYHDNKTLNNKWMVCDKTINPSTLKMPLHVISASRDRLVPPASSLTPPPDTHPYSRLSNFDTGHIGLMAGSHAKQEIWPAISSWICAIPHHRTAQ